MLEITVPATELWDEQNQVFIQSEERTLRMEHSLVSISKWESKWHKPFLTNERMTTEQTLDYFKFMTLTQNVDPNTYLSLTGENVKQIDEYMSDPMTATWFSKSENERIGRQQITSELIYHWMITLNIPFECQKWHINRLLTLIKIRTIKTQPKNKMSQSEIMKRNAALNAERRKRLNTKG